MSSIALRDPCIQAFACTSAVNWDQLSINKFALTSKAGYRLALDYWQDFVTKRFLFMKTKLFRITEGRIEARAEELLVIYRDFPTDINYHQLNSFFSSHQTLFDKFDILKALEKIQEQ